MEQNSSFEDSKKQVVETDAERAKREDREFLAAERSALERAGVPPLIIDAWQRSPQSPGQRVDLCIAMRDGTIFRAREIDLESAEHGWALLITVADIYGTGDHEHLTHRARAGIADVRLTDICWVVEAP